jgi:hypothetical protein
MEFVTLLEGLVIISNHIGHYERQVEFISKISQTFILQFQALQPHYRYVAPKHASFTTMYRYSYC